MTVLHTIIKAILKLNDFGSSCQCFYFSMTFRMF